MNKSQLVDALADRLGDRKAAATAVDALLQIVVDTVRSGDSVSLAGFGVFESRARAARTGRNPRTGETVAVPATTVPAFRPGTGFRNAVAGESAEAPAETVEPVAAEAPVEAPPRRRRSSRAAATNGSGDGGALNGAVDLTSVPTTTLLAEPPAAPIDDKPAKAKKPAAKKAAAKPAPKAEAKPAAKSSAKSAPKTETKVDAKKGKKSKKGKKGK
jgi:DNA-binding protein HU-beta